MNRISGQKQLTSRSKRYVLLGAMIAACGIVAYLFWWRFDSQAKPIEPSSVNAQKPDAPIIAVNARTSFAPTFPSPSSSVVMQSPAVPTLLPRTSSADESTGKRAKSKAEAILIEKKIDICGVSAEDAAFVLAGDGRVIEGQANAALTEAADKLAQSESPRDKALGLYMQAELAKSLASEIAAIGTQKCNVDQRCMGEFAGAAQQARELAAEPLAQLALTTRDPGIYAAALYACAGARAGSCEKISYLGWAAIEPDNAAVWESVAAAAILRNDAMARDDALRRAAAASRYDNRYPLLTSVLAADSVVALSPFVQTIAGVTLKGWDTSTSIMHSTGLVMHCLAAKTLDATRKSECSDFANRVLEGDESGLGLRMAAEVGKKIGWDAARMQTLQDEIDVLNGMTSEISEPRKMFSCEGLPKTNEWFRKSLSIGERGMGRERLAASGKSLAELADQYRKAKPGMGK